jgi:Complex I intermediate-associated protein 30 (CIA30)
MNIKIKNVKYFILLVMNVILISCTKDKIASSNVDGVFSIDTRVTPYVENSGKGYPGDLVRVEGVGLQSVKSIVFDGIVNTVFNPALNSDKAIFFNIPFDDKKGSRFGLQKLSITNIRGELIESDFEIIQPKPIIDDKFEPALPKVGTTVTVNGSWFIGVSSVKFAGNSVNFTNTSSKLITFLIPTTATVGGDVEVTTPGGIAKRFLDIDLGFDVVKISDFDGGGLRPNSNWSGYGDFDTYTYSNVGAVVGSGNYAQLTWKPKTPAAGYNGAQTPQSGTPFLKPTATDANTAFLQIDVNGAIGTKFDIILNDGADDSNWTYSYTITSTNWKILDIKLSDFGFKYNSGNQTNGDPNPSKINQVKISIAQNGGTVNPSTVQFDNIKMKSLR